MKQFLQRLLVWQFDPLVIPLMVVVALLTRPSDEWALVAAIAIFILFEAFSMWMNDRAEQEKRRANPDLTAALERITTLEKAIENVGAQVSKINLSRMGLGGR